MREMEFPSYPSAVGPRLRWSAIFAGAVVTLATLASLNVLGVGLGLLPAAANGNNGGIVATPGPGGAWWTLACSLASFYAGGWLGSRLLDSGHRSDGVIYGLTTWATASLTAIYIPAPALGGALMLAETGVFVFLTLLVQAIAAAAGGMTGARLYLPVPVTEYRKSHREFAGVR